MNLANFITSLRIILSPLFVFVYFFPKIVPGTEFPVIIVLIILFAIIELTDLFDGMAARKTNSVSDLGKLLDPFADSIARLTYFFCFMIAGHMHFIIFLLVMYRDLGVSFGRTLMAQKGVSMSARLSGKIKAWVYAVAGGSGLVYMLTLLVPSLAFAVTPVKWIMWIVFILTGITAVWTLLDYVLFVKKHLKNGD